MSNSSRYRRPSASGRRRGGCRRAASRLSRSPPSARRRRARATRDVLGHLDARLERREAVAHLLERGELHVRAQHRRRRARRSACRARPSQSACSRPCSVTTMNSSRRRLRARSAASGSWRAPRRRARRPRGGTRGARAPRRRGCACDRGEHHVGGDALVRGAEAVPRRRPRPRAACEATQLREVAVGREQHARRRRASARPATALADVQQTSVTAFTSAEEFTYVTTGTPGHSARHARELRRR